jgi:hypothetical protein
MAKDDKNRKLCRRIEIADETYGHGGIWYFRDMPSV